MRTIFAVVALLSSLVTFAQTPPSLEGTLTFKPAPTPDPPVKPIQVVPAPQVCIAGAPTTVPHCQNPRVDCTPCHGNPFQPKGKK